MVTRKKAAPAADNKLADLDPNKSPLVDFPGDYVGDNTLSLLAQMADQGGADFLSEPPPRDEQDAKTALLRVSAMADLLRKAQKSVAAATAELEKETAALVRIEQQDFPDLLREVGLTELKLDDGAVLSLVEDIQCGISEDRKPRAFAWLREHDFDGIIKSQVIVEFGRGEDKARADAIKLLTKSKLVPIAKDTVHAATLKSLLKEQRAKPIEKDDTPKQKAAKRPPADVFGIFPTSKVKLKEPKK